MTNSDILAKPDVKGAEEPDLSSRLSVFAQGFAFPTSLAFDENGRMFLAESGLPFAGEPSGGRIWQIEDDGSRRLLLEGLRPPVNGLTCHDGWMYISEGGYPARISRWKPGRTLEEVISGFPGPGNYHLNMSVIGPNEDLYFSHGAMTNTGIIGLDAYELGWLRRLPHAHDVPGYDITLSGINIETSDPTLSQSASARTGAFSPFGVSTQPGQQIQRRLPCTASVMRCKLDGSSLELIAWGLRNAYGLCFLRDGRLLATDQGADDRGSRPVGGVPDLLFEVKPGGWYGWPDFICGKPITHPAFRPMRGPAPSFVLANHNQLPVPERALMQFPEHVGAVKLAEVPAHVSRWRGQILVALFGDERPMTAPPGPRAGRNLASINTRTWDLKILAAPFFERPIDIAFHPVDPTLFVLDFGQFEMNGHHGISAEPRSGRIWRLFLG
jgi:glucose/arabinose dehydrogenase